MRQILRVTYFNIVLTCVVLVGMELAGQVLFLLLKGYPIYESDRHLIPWSQDSLFELHPYLAGRPRGNVQVEWSGTVYTTTSLHTRWTGAPAGSTNSIRVALVGGSTTFGVGITDKASWPTRLQELLGVGYSVTNYGVPGYSTAEGIVQLALLVPEIHPDIVVLYEGWNDIRNYHGVETGPDYYSHGMSQYTTLKLASPHYENLLTKLQDISAICRLAVALSKKPVFQIGSGNAQGEQIFGTPDPFIDRIYLRNLRTMKVLTRQMPAYALFVPQVLDLSRYQGKKGSQGWTPHIANDAMPDLLRRFNLIMNQVCGPTESGCAVLKEVLAQKWEPEDFVDWGHFSASGSKKFAELVAARIRSDVKRFSIQPKLREGNDSSAARPPS
jgi:lysophospholipase L1-like esterase